VASGGAPDARHLITIAFESGAQLEDVQKAAGHRDLDTTKLYDPWGYNPGGRFFSDLLNEIDHDEDGRGTSPDRTRR